MNRGVVKTDAANGEGPTVTSSQALISQPLSDRGRMNRSLDKAARHDQRANNLGVHA